MKVKYAFTTTESEEPLAVQSFIDGYELNGGTWSGTIDIEESVTNQDVRDSYEQWINEGYEMYIRNGGVDYSQLSINSDMISRGILPVVPVGSNYFHEAFVNENLFSVIFCGSGDREFDNATSYPCMFYDCSTQETYQEIVDIRQCGTSYNITHISRISSGTIGIKLSGYSTLALLNSIGFIMYENSSHSNHSDVPVYLSGITGSDIGTIPSGIKYVSYVGNGEFWITHTTTSGTIGSYQAVTGVCKFGGNDATQVMIQLRDYTSAFDNLSGITLKGLTDFANNPNGAIAVSSYINNLGFGDKITITYTLGAGNYTGGGEFLYATQSYSTPFIAGQLAYIKDTTGYDWYDVIGNAITTATNSSVYNGYGYLNGIVASDTLIDVALTTPVISELGNAESSVEIEWEIIPFADSYEIWSRGELLDTIDAHLTTYNIEFANRQSRSRKNFIKVRAKRGDTYSEFSNQIEYPYYYYSGILVKQYA